MRTTVHDDSCDRCGGVYFCSCPKLTVPCPICGRTDDKHSMTRSDWPRFLRRAWQSFWRGFWFRGPHA